MSDNSLTEGYPETLHLTCGLSEGGSDEKLARGICHFKQRSRLARYGGSEALQNFATKFLIWKLLGSELTQSDNYLKPH